MRQVAHAHDQKFAVAAIEGGVAVQGEGGARREAAHGARAHVDLLLRLQRLQLVLRDAFALFARFVGIGARRVAAGEGDALARAGRGGARAAHAVIPAADVDRVGLQFEFAAPAIDAVAFHHRARLGEGHVGLGIRLEAAVMVGDDEGVAASALCST